MALFKFTKAILDGEPVDVYHHGDMSRDFTYIDDLINGMRLLIDAVSSAVQHSVQGIGADDSLSSVAPFRVVNIGNLKPAQLQDFVCAIEETIGKKAEKNLMPMQAGDVPSTWADTSLIRSLTGYQSRTDLATGVRNFVRWYREYYNI